MRGVAFAALLAVSIGASSAVKAADLFNDEPPIYIPTYSSAELWTGFYFGGHIGGAWGDVEIGDEYAYNSPDPFKASNIDTTDLIVGVQLGYNQQSGNILYGIVISIGTVCYGVPIYSTIPRWFSRRREMALGIIESTLGLGGVLLIPLSQWVIITYGWRIAALALGLLMITIVIPLAQLMKHSPQRIGLMPYGESDSSEKKPTPTSAAPGSV